MDSPVKPKKPKLMKKPGDASSWSGLLGITAVSTETAAPEALLPNDSDLFHKVFTNDIVWHKLGSYLSLDDLKDCRLTCQLFNKKTIDVKSFRDRAHLSIPLSKFRASDLGITGVQWRHLAIDVDRDKDVTNTGNWLDSSQDPLSDLSPILSSIISLKMYRTICSNFGLPIEVPPTLYTILPMMTNIQKTMIDLKVFEKVDLSWFEKASVNLMSKVKEFHVECNSANSVPDEVMRCSMSLPLACVNLQVLRIDLFVGAWSYRRARGSAIDRLCNLFLILQQNQNHLRSFQVADPLLWTNISENICGTLPKFPQLKVLKLKMDTEESSQLGLNEAHLIQFLNNQPESLEEIDLDFIGPIPPTVFQFVKGRAMSLKLKVLRIVTTDFTPSCMQEWSFLKETNLEEFSFQLDEGSVWLSNEQVKQFFSSLPKNIKKLSVAGVVLSGAQPVLNLAVSKCFDSKLLTHLNLRGFVGLFNDAALQDFWKTLKNLRLLDLSNCATNCSDWGFTGVPIGAAPQGASISSLAGLKSLTLQYCFSLTDRTLMDGIQFPGLQLLDLQHSVQFTKTGYLAVMRQNPSLQTFVTDHDHDTHENLLTHLDHTRQIRLAKINSRLTRQFRLDERCERCRRG